MIKSPFFFRLWSDDLETMSLSTIPNETLEGIVTSLIASGGTPEDLQQLSLTERGVNMYLQDYLRRNRNTIWLGFVKARFPTFEDIDHVNPDTFKHRYYAMRIGEVIFSLSPESDYPHSHLLFWLGLAPRLVFHTFDKLRYFQNYGLEDIYDICCKFLADTVFVSTSDIQNDRATLERVLNFITIRDFAMVCSGRKTLTDDPRLPDMIQQLALLSSQMKKVDTISYGDSENIKEWIERNGRSEDPDLQVSTFLSGLTTYPFTIERLFCLNLCWRWTYTCFLVASVFKS